MAQKISITLDSTTIDFIDSQTNNRSQFINAVLSQLHKQHRLKELEQAYIEQANDEAEIEEMKLWDATVGDALDEDE